MVGNVVVVGSCNLDLIVEVGRLPTPGQTVLGGDVISRPGGKGANQAVAARRLGARTTLFGAIGDDQFGLALRGALDDVDGLDLAHLVTVDGPTGVALIVVDSAAENQIAVAAGANARFSARHLAALPDLLSPSSILLLQLEVPVTTCVAAAEIARGAGARVVLNAAPLPSHRAEDLSQLLALTDVLVVNEGEATGLLRGSTPAHVSSWEAVAAQLTGLGPGAAVITLGADGAVLADDAAASAHAAFPVEPVDTTGAGDAFCGGLAVALARRLPLQEAVRWGNAAGALATSALGAQTALPTAAAVIGLQRANQGAG